MRAVNTLAKIDSAKVKTFWRKYGFVIFCILLIYAGIKTFYPSVKTIEKVVVDTEATTKLQKEITRLTQVNKSLNKQIRVSKKVVKNIVIDEIVEITHPDDRVEKRPERKTGDTSITVSGIYEESSKATETDLAPFWSTSIGYQYRGRQCILGQGINIGRSFNITALGSYKFDPDASKKWDAGGMITMRY